MNDKSAVFLDKLYAFCRESLDWCRKESEVSISKVNDIVSILISDADRVSAVSRDTLEAVASMKGIIENLLPDGDRKEANKLAIALQEAAKHDEQIHNFVAPIIETLQFQDRISQNMDNLGKMIKIWLAFRAEHGQGDKLDPELMKQFGKQLMDVTTMIEERDLIREQIAGLEGEAAKPEVLFF